MLKPPVDSLMQNELINWRPLAINAACVGGRQTPVLVINVAMDNACATISTVNRRGLRNQT